MKDAVRSVLAALREWGVLLETDRRLPSVAALVAGEVVRGSWWAHRRGAEIYRVSLELAEHPDVLGTRLVSGKLTHVHRRLWPAVYAVATERGPWQTRGLSAEARRLLRRVERDGTADASGEPVRELERRLLVLGESVHTETGAHRKRLRSWSHWAARRELTARFWSAERGRREIESVAAALSARFGGVVRLPWSAGASRGGP